MNKFSAAGLGVALALGITAVVAQQKPAPQAAPTATPNMCNQYFSGYTQDSDGNLMGFAPPAGLMAIPYDDVKFYHEQALEVVKVLNQEQGKPDGTFTIVGSEVQECDGGPRVRIASTSGEWQGLTYQGLNKVGRAQYKQADATLKRHEDRQGKGAKSPWNTKNGPKTELNEAGQFVPPGQAKKQ